jgi:DNA-binding beta-propeller fold protein YncE
VDSLDKLFIADGNDGNCKVYRGSDLSLLGAIPLDLGPDHEAYDPVRKQLYVGYGGEDANKDYGELGIIDAVADKHAGDVRTDSHPGAVIVEHPGRTVLITNPKSREIAVVDEQSRAVTSKWVIPEQLPVALALDAAHHRLFVGTRQPPRLLVFDENSHKLITSLPSVGLMDDLYFDAARRRIYASGGEGFVSVYQQLDADHYKQIASIPTGPVARTSLLVPKFNRYYVAVPAAADRGAEIQVYEPEH